MGDASRCVDKKKFAHNRREGCVCRGSVAVKIDGRGCNEVSVKITCQE